MRNCEETIFSVTRFENRIQTALIFSFSEKKISLYILAYWSLKFATQKLFHSILKTEDTPPVVVIGLQVIFMSGHKQRYSLSRMLKDLDV